MYSPFLFLDYFQMSDDNNVHQRICLGSYSGEETPIPLSFHWPLQMSNYWQYFCLNLTDVANRVLRTNYVETVKIKVCAGRFYRWRQHCLFTLTHFSSCFCSYSVRSMETVEYEECISPTDCTLTRSCQVIIKWTFQYRVNKGVLAGYRGTGPTSDVH